MIRRRAVRAPASPTTPVTTVAGPAGNARPHLTGQPLLEITGLKVDYGVGDAAVHAVAGADLVLHSGEVLGLAGACAARRRIMGVLLRAVPRPASARW